MKKSELPKIGPNDKGGLTVVVGHENNRIILDFGASLSWIAITPQEAIKLSELLLKHGLEALGIDTTEKKGDSTS